MDIIIILGIFITTVLLVQGGYSALQDLKTSEARNVRKRLRTLSYKEFENDKNVDILKRKMLSEIPWLNRFLFKINFIHKIYMLMEQANIKYSLGLFVLISLFLMAVTFLSVSLVTTNYLISISLAILLGLVPFIYIILKKRVRMKKFERQLPEALGLIARALRAGQAFPSGLKMVADEFDDPIGTEFRETIDEINFGINVNDALKNLANKIESTDLKFFVISVIIQRESGGNLADILDSIANIIRERFKLEGKIKSLAAEGKLSAIILGILPFALVMIFLIVNPGYITLLLSDIIGEIMALFAIVLMSIGIFIMRKMIRIDW